MQVLEKIKKHVLKGAETRAGSLPRPEFFNNGNFDEDYFAEFREKRLASLLANHVRKVNGDIISYTTLKANGWITTSKRPK